MQTSSTVWQVQSKYGYNQTSNVKWRQEVLADGSFIRADQDLFYSYDGLNQVTQFQRGLLDPSSGPPYAGISPVNASQQIGYDKMWNWTGYAGHARNRVVKLKVAAMSAIVSLLKAFSDL